MSFDIEVNNKIISVKRGETILTALNRSGIRVPSLCNVRGLSPSGACRICVVELEGQQKLVTSCSEVVEEGMKVFTHSPRVLRARKTLVELLLCNHPDDCLYCERNGNCELQDLSIELNIRERRLSGKKPKHRLDLSSPSITRDPAKCILCGRCVRICGEIQNVYTLDFINRGAKTLIGTTMNKDLNFSSCIDCGQCVMVCTTGALHERSNIDEIQDVINNKAKKVVVQIDPAISVSLAEEFDLKPGKEIQGQLIAALKKIGFDLVFDTSFASDVTLMEFASEFDLKLKSKDSEPLITSNCSAWIKFAEQFYPSQLPKISTCKSPQQVMGTMIKGYLAKKVQIDPTDIFSVSITSCLAKKFEAQRAEMTSRGLSDVDLVLTTRELAKLIKLYGIDIQSIEPLPFDPPFNIRTSAGILLSNAGGTAEAIVRTLYFLRTGKEMKEPKINELRSQSGSKEVNIKIGKENLKILLLNGFININEVMGSVAEGKLKPHLIEVMACPGGCVNGGGQPFGASEKDVKTRAKVIYDLAENENIKSAHNNPLVSDLYKDYLESCGSEKAKKLFHVKYSQRNVLL